MKALLEFEVTNQEIEKLEDALKASIMARLINVFLDYLHFVPTLHNFDKITPRELFEEIYARFCSEIIARGLINRVGEDLRHYLDPFLNEQYEEDNQGFKINRAFLDSLE